MADLAGDSDDAMFAGEGFGVVDHPVQHPGDVRVVLGMLVGEQQFGGRDDLTRCVSVHLCVGLGPFPPLPVQENRKPPTRCGVPSPNTCSASTPWSLAHRLLGVRPIRRVAGQRIDRKYCVTVNAAG